MARQLTRGQHQSTRSTTRGQDLQQKTSLTVRHPADVPGKAGELGTLRPLPRDFYARDTLTVARSCIGALLVCRKSGQLRVGRIVEAEAYRGPEDKAAHSYGNRRTPRTEAMFGKAGHAYLFLLYGLHHHFNLVTGRVGQPQAVLVRAIEPLLGAHQMAQARGVSPTRPELTNGPGKLCQALGLDMTDYARDLTGGTVFLAEGHRHAVARSARIGIDYAGAWAEKPWRFFEPGNRYLSGPSWLNTEGIQGTAPRSKRQRPRTTGTEHV